MIDCLDLLNAKGTHWDLSLSFDSYVAKTTHCIVYHFRHSIHTERTIVIQ